ncbi:unnamed protein product [Wuchereria bancrofti]|uniref:Chondroitin proteoglycan 4 domain-containing protein n=1 Tax=Wuchereria bancrofti TaxID=6293 RepID=A0A3P7DK40_WUCBA|nr:unnamed protein product [Wuchereria bancrofti]
MKLILSVLLNLFCSFLCIFQLAEGQFNQNNEQSVKRIIDVDESFSNLNSINAKTLDVQKLNRLISTIDKTWILPQIGAHEPVGSNFKYKKTCANIYQIEKNICQHVGFGTMCFNYCYEQGEILKFRCENVADLTYCKNNSAFNSFLMQYRNDPYKTKSYIRQMISRCYATAICDTQYGILNTTIIDENNEWESDNTVTNSNLNKNYANQQETSQITSLPEIEPKRPIPIWQLLLLRHKMITEAKPFPPVKTSKSSAVDEIVTENSKRFENTIITDGNKSMEINIKSTPENTREILTEETTISTKQTIPRKNQNEMEIMERLWWLYKALQQMDKRTDCVKEQ